MSDFKERAEGALQRSGVEVRPVERSDMAAIHAIYAWHVENGLGSFEEVAPSQTDMQARAEAIVGDELPYLVATIEEAVVGYAYAGFFHPRSAYRFCLEDSVYVSRHAHGRGVGSALLAALIERCEAGPWRQLVALVGDRDNAGSIALHERFGFTRCGVLEGVGFKFDRWVDVVVMQRPLGAGHRAPPGAE